MSMLQQVDIGATIRAKDFLQFLASAQRGQLLAYAEQLKGKRIAHLSATAQGGGVAELLKSAVPYMRALGIEASWHAIDAKEAGKGFFDFTNRLHNALQGSIRKFSKEEWRRYATVNRKIAHDAARMEYDILVVHDPQPMGAVQFLKKQAPKVCVVHVDTSSPDPAAWNTISSWLKRYDKIIFSDRGFVHKGLPKEKARIIPPAIDPLAPKQKIVAPKEARRHILRFGIPAEGELAVQVSRFDVWKNPYGLLEAFWLLEERHKTALLLLVGFQEARDNPQAEKVFADIRGMAGKDPRIFLFFHPSRIGGVGHIQEFTAMAQNAADIVAQNSLKEGFGLTVAEAMWKGKPVVGGPAAGIRRQIRHGENGYIAQNTKQLVSLLDSLLTHPADRERLGKAAKESVRQNFLMPRYVLEHLRVYADMLHEKPAAR